MHGELQLAVLSLAAKNLRLKLICFSLSNTLIYMLSQILQGTVLSST